MKLDVDWNGWGKKLYAVFSKYKYVVLVILAGVILLLLPTFGGEKTAAAPPAAEAAAGAFDLEAMERKLSEALSEIDGAGQVRVVLTLKSSARQIVAQDGTTSEKDSSTTTVVVSKGSGVEDTVVLQEVYPQYQGALVVCPGGGDPAVKLKLVGAVSAVTGLGAGRISVCKGN